MARAIKFRVWSSNVWKMREVAGIRFVSDKIDVIDNGMPIMLEKTYEGEFELMQYTGLKDKSFTFGLFMRSHHPSLCRVQAPRGAITLYRARIGSVVVHRSKSVGPSVPWGRSSGWRASV